MDKRDVTPNARFWHWHRDSLVKLTLKPGQTLHHHYGSDDQEGWSWYGSTWTHDGDTLTWAWCDDGADCDGRLTQSGETACALTALYAGSRDESGLVVYPAWSDAKRWQRDYAAEALGY